MANAPTDINALVEQKRPDIENLLGSIMADEKKRFIALAVRAVNHSDFTNCTQESKLNCIIQAAASRLELGTHAKLAYLIKYGNEVTFQPSYVGLIQVAVDAGVAADIYADVVCEKDHFEVISGSRRELVHKPKVFGERGKVIGAYSSATLLNGLTSFEIMEMKDIDAVKAAALRNARRHNKDADLSPAWRFFETEMIKKSAIRRLCKRLQGNRRGNPEANERFNRTLDAEFSRVPDEDDPPIAEELESKTKGDSAVSKPNTHTPAPQPKADIRPINEEEIDLLDVARNDCGLKPSQTKKLLQEKFGVADFSSLKTDQIADVVKAMGQAAAA